MLFLQASTPGTSTVFEILLKVGPFILIPFVLLFSVAVYLIIERYLAYRQMAKIDQRFIDNVKRDLVEGELKSAMQSCESQEGALPIILHAGLKTMSTGGALDEIEKSMEGMANLVFSRITTPLSILGLIAGIAPMLGFVGTIWGVIIIFFNISQTNNVEIGNIANGLYIKMITSFLGLVIGIFAYSGYHGINYLIEKLGLKIETEVYQFLNFLKEPTK